jgi:pimeloyl-ACP methyl ester carboxylesterase
MEVPGPTQGHPVVDVPHGPLRTVAVGDLELCHDTFGDPSRPAMLLIMGMGFQLVHWPDDLCRELARAGFHVIRFDNRDSGGSTHLAGRRYRLEDMAEDAAGLLDALGAGSAHVVGASLGGMVAQTLALRHPERVRSLASVMSTTGRRGVGRTSLRVFRHAFGRPPRTAQEAVERRVRVFATIGSPGFEQDLDELRRVTALAHQRDPDARGGRRRQHQAVRAAGDRTEELGRLSIPTVVIHGTEDLMCHPSGGRATAAAVPGARLELIEGMGHDLPRGAWPRIVDAITENARRAELEREDLWAPRS